MTSSSGRDIRKNVTPAKKPEPRQLPCSAPLRRKEHNSWLLEEHADAMRARDLVAMEHAVYRCAQLHVQLTGANVDPHHAASSGPLDFGHWAVHKPELMKNLALRHGEAVEVDSGRWEISVPGINTVMICGNQFFPVYGDWYPPERRGRPADER